MSAWFRFCICSFEGTMNEYSSLAQSVEHAAVNRSVVGSSPTGGVFYCPEMRIEKISSMRFFILFIKKTILLSEVIQEWFFLFYIIRFNLVRFKSLFLLLQSHVPQMERTK